MPKNSGQKTRILHVLDILLKYSDEEHLINVSKIQKELNKAGIVCDRKAIYDDINTLEEYGYDILKKKGTGGGYAIISRDFELAELKLLCDAVQASKFITEKKSKALTKKLSAQTSIYQAKNLNRQIYFSQNLKTENESIYYNVDFIYNAISKNRKISFQYYEHTITKEKRLRNNGQSYIISPLALIWDDENYYMLGYDGTANINKHFRVDKMQNIEVLNELRDERAVTDEEELSDYSKKTFGMFGGNETLVSLRCSDSIIGVIIDRFGRDINIIKDGERHFRISTRINVSPQFFSWVFGLEDKIQIVSPQSVIDKFVLHAKTVLLKY